MACLWDYYAQTLYVCRCFMIVSGPGLTGSFDLAPADAEPEDALCIIWGCSVPVVLTPRPEGGYVLIGECYIHGLMDGELLDDDPNLAVRQDNRNVLFHIF